MKTIPEPNLKAARRKLKKAALLLAEAASLTSKATITLRVHRTASRPEPKIVTETSHKPSRRPTEPFPMPQPGALHEPLTFAPAIRLPVTGACLESTRRKKLAVEFARETDHPSGLHRADPEKVLWREDHHPECRRETGGRECDCGFVLLFRTNPEGQSYDVMPDGQIERYDEPLTPALHRERPAKYYARRSWDVRAWFNDCINEEPELFTIVGEGEDERFLEHPGETELPKI